MREAPLADDARDAGRHRSIAFGLYAASFALHAWAARELGVAAGEGTHLKAALDAGQLVAKARAAGFGSISRAMVDQALSSGKPSSAFPTLLSGLTWQLLADHDGKHLDPLTALRLGVVLISALTPALVFLLAKRPLGASMALAAALFALFVPRAIENAAILSGDGVLTALLVASVLTYVRARAPRGHAYGILSAGLLGLAISVSFAALLLVPVLAAHTALTNARSTERLLPRGEIPLAGAIAWLPIVGAATFFGTQPYLWNQTFDRTRDLLIQAGSPHIGSGLWSNIAPTADALPRAHALAMLLASLPSITAVLALVGVALWMLRVWSGERTSSALALSASLVATFVFWPYLCPPALATFPTHFTLAIPFVAILAAYGAGALTDALQRRFPEFQSRGFGKSLVVAMLLPALFSCFSPITSSASFPLLVGGTSRAARSQTVPLQDATPVGGLAKIIDGVAKDGASIYAPDIPNDALEWMQRLGRLHAKLHPVTSPVGANLLVLAGNVDVSFTRNAKMTASVRREGQDVLTLIVP